MGFDMFDIAGSGMHAQRVKMDTISSNIANANSTRNAKGEVEVYKKKEVSFQAVYDTKFKMPELKNTQRLVTDWYSDPELRGSIRVEHEDRIAKGVMVSSVHESKQPFKQVYDPSHPDSDENGFLTLPNVNVVEEMVNLVNASKAYEANAAIANTAKTMISAALGI
ncbi:flagellar basal-body rod protein FlgC [Candidatus Gastranaerophilus sp. (ex Termes propinquus)]|nr:flagellar basal-body rod protein FlgC [Candidatus Gastranaerophilus sp. (ex Termes propinquus)]